MFTACAGSFPSSHGEKHPDPKSSQEVDPDKPGCTTSCLRGKTDPYFCVFFFYFFFCFFFLRSLTLLTNPRIVELVVGSAAVEQAHITAGNSR